MKPTNAELRRMKVSQAGQRRVILEMDNEDKSRTKKSNTPSIPSGVFGMLKLATVVRYQMGFLAVWSKLILLGSGVGVLRGVDG